MNQLKPYYDHGGITIYHGDCREILPSLSVGVDALVTDPPYGIINRFGIQGGGKRGIRRLEFDWDNPKTTEIVLSGLDLAMDLINPRGACFVFCGGDQFGAVLDFIRSKRLQPSQPVGLRNAHRQPRLGIGGLRVLSWQSTATDMVRGSATMTRKDQTCLWRIPFAMDNPARMGTQLRSRSD